MCLAHSMSMPAPRGNTNNPNRERNLRPFDDPEKARAAAAKSAESRRKNKLAKQQAEAAINRDLNEWMALYERDKLGEMCAAAAQKVAHMILSGEISDHRSLVQALPVLVDIARLEQGLHTSATMHANVTMSAEDARAKLETIRSRALTPLSAEVVTVEGEQSSPSTDVER